MGFKDWEEGAVRCRLAIRENNQLSTIYDLITGMGYGSCKSSE
jgi:hypothetical protein